MKQIVALKGTIQNKTRELNDSLVGMSSFQEPNQKRMCGWDGDIVLERFQNLFLHRNNLGREKMREELCEKRNTLGFILLMVACISTYLGSSVSTVTNVDQVP
jgi:hypothetical protein